MLTRAQTLFGHADAGETLFRLWQTEFARQARSQTGVWEREEKIRLAGVQISICASEGAE